MNCKNCESPLTGHFCVNCGQKAEIHRVTFKHFLHDFFHAFTHTDKGILLLIKELVTRPGFVAREYLDGKRKKYFNPLTFLIIMASLYAYFGSLTGYFEALSAGQGPAKHPIHAEVMSFMDHYGKIVNLFLSPVLISFFSWLFFIRSKNNLTENLVLNSMVMGQIYLFTILMFIPAFYFIPAIPVFYNNIFFHLLMIVYLSTAYRQFFKNNIIVVVLKVLAIIILFIIFFWIFIIGYVMLKHMILG
jgi:hypothetical protein